MQAPSGRIDWTECPTPPPLEETQQNEALAVDSFQQYSASDRNGSPNCGRHQREDYGRGYGHRQDFDRRFQVCANGNTLTADDFVTVYLHMHSLKETPHMVAKGRGRLCRRSPAP